MAFGFIDSLELLHAADGDPSTAMAIAQIDLLGELISSRPGKPPSFARGISVFPVLGAPLFVATPDDLSLIYARPDTWTMVIGSLYQDIEKPAYLLSQEFLSKHSAIVGTTGSGKSCALTLVLRTLLINHPNGHVVMVDPHGEYATAFPGMAECLTTANLQLPYWLLSFEELVEVLCSRDASDRSRETVILKEIILAAKRDYVGANGHTAYITVDTPVPYRMPTVLQKINEAMGKLDRPDNTLPYLRLLTTIENLRRDRRYGFMFEGFAVRDNLTDIISRILRIPVSGRPLTILDISSVPSEIVNVVMSVLCRLIFDFALQTDRDEAIPILLVCDEAHRYIPRDESSGFEPTRRSISRIAKEGRKYGVSLCLVTQRPSELSESILSQCSTVFALRMTNDKDQSYVRSMLPDSASGLLNTLPTLRQREAIITGEGVAHPMRIRFAELLPEHRPKGEATNFPKAWQNDLKDKEFVSAIVERWRRQ
jgi:DNA helicase HerA-like ATPase